MSWISLRRKATEPTELVHKGEYTEETTAHFAVNENNRMQYYFVRSNFPDAEITLYPSIDACLEAVLAEEVSCTTLNGLRANDILKNSKYKGLVLHQLTRNDDRCFGVEIGNEGLLKLLNRGIVAVTANAFEEDKKVALEAGMNGHLAKPYDIPAIMDTLKRLLK